MTFGDFWVLSDLERKLKERSDKMQASLDNDRETARERQLMRVIADVRSYPGDECPEDEFTTILLRNGIEPSSLTRGELYEINNSL